MQNAEAQIWYLFVFTCSNGDLAEASFDQVSVSCHSRHILTLTIYPFLVKFYFWREDHLFPPVLISSQQLFLVLICFQLTYFIPLFCISSFS